MMKRKLAVILAAAMMVLMPMAAHALGFGNLTLHSALNEQLDADIELLSPTEDDLANIKVKLASTSAFERAGIERTALLTELRFKVKELDNGNYVVHLTTRIPVREPFMNFLLELEWQNGRMLREYTMLLDPPGIAKKQPTMVEAPVAAPEVVPEPTPVAAPFAEAEPEVVAEPELIQPEAAPVDAMPLPEPAAEPEIVQPEPVQAEAEPLPGDTAPVAEEIAMPMGDEVAPTEAETFEDDSQLFPSVPLTSYKESASDDGIVEVEAEAEMADAPATELDSVTEPASDSTAVAGGQLGDLDYGIVQKGDNLWTIAEKLRQDDQSLTVYQVMMALLRSNPDAFVNGNVNRLKVGHVLRIEDPTMLADISAVDAAREYQSQTAIWEEYRQSVAQRASDQPIIGSEVSETETEVVDAGGELTLSSPETTQGELQGGTGVSEEAVNNDILTLQDELRQVSDDAAAMRGQNSELNSKLRELEDELSTKQRSISLQDDELAALQQQLSNLKGDVASQTSAEIAQEETAALQEEPVVEQQSPNDITTESGLADSQAEQPIEDVTEETLLTEEASEQLDDQEIADATDAMQTDMAETAMDEAETEAQTETQIAEPAVTTEQPAPVDEEDAMGMVTAVFDSIGQSVSGIFSSIAAGSLLIFIAIPVLLVLVILAFVMIRRRNKSDDNFQESILSGEPASGIDSVTSGTGAEEESSFLSDFAVSGAGAIQTEDSEVDPLTEADVFMAYGRYEAAEERLKEAVEAEPARPELKLKLIELYYSTKNKPAFENAAEDFYAAVGENASDDPGWQKVASMGAELVPANPIFSGASAPAESSFEEDISDVSSLSLTDSQVMDIGLDTGVFAASDFNTDEASSDDFNLDEPSENSVESDVADIDSGVMEFNMDSDTLTTGAVSDTSSDATAVDAEGPDFSLDISSDVGAAADLTDDSLLDFNLDLGSSSEPSAEPAVADANSNEMEFSLDDSSSDSGALDFDLDLGSEPAVDIETATADESADASLDFEVNASDAGDLDMGGDEVGTKLDLAKAYIDMGDPDGAKSILDEVMGEGNDSQKSEAEELLQQIG